MNPDLLSPEVLEALEERGINRERISKMSAYDVLNHFLIWNGIIGYTRMIQDAVNSINEAVADKN